MYRNLIDIPVSISNKYPDRVSHRFKVDGGFRDVTYSEFVTDIKHLSLGFYKLGIKSRDHVTFLVNNRYEWTLIDFALQSISAVSVPRGSDTTPKEAEFIYDHSDSKHLIIENTEQFNSDRSICLKAEIIILIDDGDIPAEFAKKTFLLKDLIIQGELLDGEENNLYNSLLDKIEDSNIVSIIYTSGTTGNPKGVMLTQKNFVENVHQTAYRMEIDESVGEVTVSILPAWHAFERTFEYAGLSYGISVVYSSIKTFGQDILREKPHIIASVPRLWDSIYFKMKVYLKSLPRFKRGLFNFFVKLNLLYKKRKHYLNKSYVRFTKEKFYKGIYRTFFSILTLIVIFPLHLLAEAMFKGVRAKVGGRLRCAISGGGSLPVAIDQFFQAVGIQILNAYGMTECSPGIASRTIKKNSMGTIGIPFDKTYMKIVGSDGFQVKKGLKGVLYVQGPQVMQGYYKNPEATKEVLSDDGWLCTGDLARETDFGEYVLVGRSKDTIVLLGGENVDPLPIEDKIQESDMIDHAMLLGQDKKGLTAFIALNQENLSKFADDLKVKISVIFKPDSDTNKPSKEYLELEKKVKSELDKKISTQEGFKPFEKITKVILVKNTFKIGRELTQTLKIKRKQIEKKYKKLISRFLNEGE